MGGGQLKGMFFKISQKLTKKTPVPESLFK